MNDGTQELRVQPKQLSEKLKLPGFSANRSKAENHIGFDARFSPLQERLYRTAMILTKSHRAADRLLTDTYYQARKLYAHSMQESYFGFWISHILLRTFTRK